MKHHSDHQRIFLKYNIDIVLTVNVTVPESTEGNFFLSLVGLKCKFSRLDLGIWAENNVLQYHYWQENSFFWKKNDKNAEGG